MKLGKRILLSLIMAMLLLLPAASAFADMGIMEIDEFSVFVGPEGYTFSYWDYGERTATLEMGTKIRLIGDAGPSLYGEFEYNGQNQGVLIDKSDIGKFIQEKENVSPEIGERLTRSVRAEVTADPWLNMRYGPASGFEVKMEVPAGSVVKYDCVYGNWAFASFNGEHGWLSLDYLKTVEDPKPADTDGTGEAAQPSENEPSVQPEPAGQETEQGGTASAEATQPAESAQEADGSNADEGSRSAEASFVGSRPFYILIACVAGAVILCLTAFVTFRLIRRRKESE